MLDSITNERSMCGGEVGKITHMVLIPKSFPARDGLFKEILQHGRAMHKTRRGATILYYMNKKGTQVNKRYVYES